MCNIETTWKSHLSATKKSQKEKIVKIAKNSMCGIHTYNKNVIECFVQHCMRMQLTFKLLYFLNDWKQFYFKDYQFNVMFTHTIHFYQLIFYFFSSMKYLTFYLCSSSMVLCIVVNSSCCSLLLINSLVRCFFE